VNGWDEVLGLVDSAEPVTTNDEMLVVASATDPGHIIADLQDWFGGGEDRQTVRLVLDGDDRGVVRRADAYQLARSSDRGPLGGGDYATLPGVAKYDMFQLSCPVPGCHVHGRAITYPKPPPSCGVHHVALVIAKA
jgi:hypothetical protein